MDRLGHLFSPQPLTGRGVCWDWLNLDHMSCFPLPLKPGTLKRMGRWTSGRVTATLGCCLFFRNPLYFIKLVSLVVLVVYCCNLRVITPVPSLKRDYLFTSQADQREEKHVKIAACPRFHLRSLCN